MKVIICGAGQVGTGIAERLSAEGNDVSIIDTSAELVQRANDTLDARAIQGNAAHPDVLEQAGARDADMLIAVTLSDEVNMVACQAASCLFDIPTKIARVRSQAYFDKEWATLFSRENMAIDVIISPEVEVGNTILRRLEVPGAFETVTFADGRITALGIACGPECPVVDTPLTQLADLFPDLPAVTVAIVRQGRLFIPHGRDQIRAGDDTYVVTPSEQVARTLQIFGHEETKARRVVIAGGGNIGLYLARQLNERDPGVRVKVIESSRARANDIAEKLPNAVVLHGSALVEDVLREAEVDNADTMVAVTNDDQVNLLAAALAKQLGCRSTLSLINSSNYAGMIRTLGIDAQIDPRAVTVSRVLQHVRRGRIRGIHSIHNGGGEIIEAEVLDTAPIISRPLREFKNNDGYRFGAILRGTKVLKPTGGLEFESKDRVVLFALAEGVRDVEQMFRVSPDYF